MGMASYQLSYGRLKPLVSSHAHSAVNQQSMHVHSASGGRSSCTYSLNRLHSRQHNYVAAAAQKTPHGPSGIRSNSHRQAASQKGSPQHSSSQHSAFDSRHSHSSDTGDNAAPESVNRNAFNKSTERIEAQAAELQRSHIEKKVSSRQGDGNAAKTIKTYAAIAKGHIMVPGGREWAGLRRRLKYRESPGLPTMQPILLVEGESDMESVTRAVNAVVYVFKGSRMCSPAGKSELSQLKQLAVAGNPLLVLTDPDKAGRTFRLTLDEKLGPCLHAFMPEPVAITPQATWFKQAGNRGVEHANPNAVVAALSSVVMSHGPNRREFTREDMIRMRLINGSSNQRVANVEIRRRIVCALLGLGECDGSQLQAALNRFFTREQLAYVLQCADSNMQRLGIKLGGSEVPKNCVAGETELVLSLA